jgi:hypothetical protein
MKPVASILKIVDFSIMQLHFDFVMSKDANDRKNPITYFKDYEIDLDFSVHEDRYFQIIMAVEINNIEKPLPGYKLSAKVATLFQFGDTSSITPDQKKSIEGFSTVYIALNNLRGIISGFTANAPFGRYTLPSIDLNDLIMKKKFAIEEVMEEKTVQIKKHTKKIKKHE